MAIQIKATVREVLFYYDGPLMVHASSDDGQDLIASVYDENEARVQLWVACRITSETLRALLASEITLQSAFMKHRVGERLLTAEHVGGEGCVNVYTEMDYEPPDDWIPGDFTLE